jgi:hypothetical protein
MLGRLRVPPRKYWEAVFIVFFDKSFHNFSLPNYQGLSANNRVLFVKELQIFLLRDVEQPSNILSSFSVVSIYDSNFIGLFDEDVNFRCCPKWIPHSLEWNFFDVFSSVLPQMLYHFSRQLILSLILEPRSFLCLWSEAVWKLGTESTSSFWCKNAAVEELGGLEKLLSAHPNSLAHALGREQRVDRLIVEFQPSVGSCIHIHGQAGGVVATALLQADWMETFNQLLRILGVEETTKLFGLVNLLKEEFRLACKFLVCKGRQLMQTMFESMEIRRAVFIKLHKPRLILWDNSVNLEFMLLKEELHLLVGRSYGSLWDSNTVAKKNRTPEDFQTKAIFLGECTPNRVKDFLNRW